MIELAVSCNRVGQSRFCPPCGPRADCDSHSDLNNVIRSRRSFAIFFFVLFFFLLFFFFFFFFIEILYRVGTRLAGETCSDGNYHMIELAVSCNRVGQSRFCHPCGPRADCDSHSDLNNVNRSRRSDANNKSVLQRRCVRVHIHQDQKDHRL